MQVYEIQIDSDVVARLPDGEASQLHSGIQWGHRGDRVVSMHLPFEDERYQKLRAACRRLFAEPSWAEVDVSAEYVEAVTAAPEEYDGFGTFTVRHREDGRLVCIPVRAKEWQLGRYASGLHVTALL